MSRVFMNKGKNMVVIDKEERIEDELVMFPSFCITGQIRCPVS